MPRRCEKVVRYLPCSMMTRQKKGRATAARQKRGNPKKNAKSKKKEKQQRKPARNKKMLKRNQQRGRPRKQKRATEQKSTSWLARLWPMQRNNNKSRKNKCSRTSRRGIHMSGDEPDHLKEVKFKSFINKLRRKVTPETTLDKESMAIMDNVVKNLMHGIASEASRKMGRKKVLKPRIILRAMRHIMPRNLREMADERGKIALQKIKDQKKSKRRHGSHYRCRR